MANTEISQTREQVINSEGNQVYRVISVVVDKGDLPHLAIFVLNINDTSDPTSDTFLRVGTPYDLTNLYTDRTAAIANDATIFLSPYVNNDYTALELAMQATQEINGRVNTLVTTWQAYYGTFYTPTAATLTFPNVDPSYVQELKDAYVSAREARISAEEALEEQTAECTSIAAALTVANDWEDILKVFVNFCDRLTAPSTGYWAILNTEINSYVGGTNSFFDAMKTAYLAYSGIAFDISVSPPLVPSGPYNMWAAMVTWFTIIKADWETAGAPQQANVGSTLTAACNSASAQYALAVNAQTNAVADASACVAEKEKATALLAVAQEAEDAALAAVVAVCPDFDPASV